MEPPAVVAALALLGFGFAFVLSQNNTSEIPKEEEILDPAAESALNPDVSSEDILPGRLSDNFNNPLCWQKYKLIRLFVCFIGFPETVEDDAVRPWKNCTHDRMHDELKLYRIWLKINKNCNVNESESELKAPSSSAKLWRLQPFNRFIFTLTLALAVEIYV